MHGYEPGEVEPTTELLLSHKHPDDRAHVAEAIARSIAEGHPFSSRHRFLDTRGGEHQVLVVAERLYRDDGIPAGTTGHYIDLSRTLARVQQEVLDDRLPEVLEARATIEQAKGVLMRIYQISAEQAFKVLVWRSQETNTKLRDLAEQFLHELPTLPEATPAAVAAADHLLLTVHKRIPKPALGGSRHARVQGE